MIFCGYYYVNTSDRYNSEWSVYDETNMPHNYKSNLSFKYPSVYSCGLNTGMHPNGVRSAHISCWNSSGYRTAFYNEDFSIATNSSEDWVVPDGYSINDWINEKNIDDYAIKNGIEKFVTIAGGEAVRYTFLEDPKFEKYYFVKNKQLYLLEFSSNDPDKTNDLIRYESVRKDILSSIR